MCDDFISIDLKKIIFKNLEHILMCDDFISIDLKN